MDDQTFDYRRVRALLAAHRIQHKDFAARCGLSVPYVSSVLCGGPAGELALIKIERGLRLLGLDKEYEQASAAHADTPTAAPVRDPNSAQVEALLRTLRRVAADDDNGKGA